MIKLEKKEKIFLAIITTMALFIAFIPYLYGYLIKPADHVFSWINIYSVQDVHVYYMYLREIIAGRFTFLDLYTLEPQAHAVINVVWLFLGLIARFLHLSPEAIFHSARLFLIPAAIILIYCFIRMGFSVNWQRFVATILAVFGSGFGVYIMPPIGKEWPMDVIVADGFPYLTFLYSPHFIASLLFFVGIIWLMYAALEKDKIKFSILAGILGLLFFNFHPYHAITLFLIFGSAIFVWLVLGKISVWRGFLHGILFLLISLPSVIYHVWLSLSDPIIAARNALNITITPPFFVVVISYGVFMIGLAAAVYFIAKIKKTPAFLVFCSIWSLVTFLLIMSGLNYGRRFTMALTIPLAILLTQVLIYFKQYFLKAWHRAPVLISIVIALLTTGTLFINVVSMFYFYNGFSRPLAKHVVYIDSSRNQAFAWLKKQPFANLRVLSSEINGNLIPGQSGQYVYLGHWAETIDPDKKRDFTKLFFSGTGSNIDRFEFLKQNNITHVFYSPLEVELGNLDPRKEFYLHEVFSSGNTSIYEVDHSAASL